MPQLWRIGLALSVVMTLTGTGIVLYSICPDHPSRALMRAGADAVAVGTIALVAALLGAGLTTPGVARPLRFLAVPDRRRFLALICRVVASSAVITVLIGGGLVLWNYCPPTSSLALENLGINLVPIGVVLLTVMALGTWLTR
jgi:hypothetical protein